MCSYSPETEGPTGAGPRMGPAGCSLLGGARCGRPVVAPPPIFGLPVRLDALCRRVTLTQAQQAAAEANAAKGRGASTAGDGKNAKKRSGGNGGGTPDAVQPNLATPPVRAGQHSIRVSGLQGLNLYRCAQARSTLRIQSFRNLGKR